MLGSSASGQGAGPALSLAGGGDGAGRGGCFLIQAWTDYSLSFKENQHSCLNGFVFFPVPPVEPLRLTSWGLWNEVSPIVASHRLDQNLKA